MKKNKTNLNLAARLLGGALFLGVFMFNVISFVQTSSDGISIHALRAYAQTGGSGNEEEETGCAKINITYATETEDVPNTEDDGKSCSHDRTLTIKKCTGVGTTSCVGEGTFPGEWGEVTCK